MQQQQHYYESLKFHLLVSISKTTKLLLASSVPAVKPNLPTICEEVQWMNLHTNSCYLQIIPIFKIKKKLITSKHIKTVQISITKNKASFETLTFIFLLELSGQVSLHKSSFSCHHSKNTQINQYQYRFTHLKYFLFPANLSGNYYLSKKT